MVLPSMRPQTPSNSSDILGLTSTGIDSVSILLYSGDSDGPMTVSSGIGAASLSDSSIGSPHHQMDWDTTSYRPVGVCRCREQSWRRQLLPHQPQGSSGSTSTRSTERLGREERQLNYGQDFISKGRMGGDAALQRSVPPLAGLVPPLL